MILRVSSVHIFLAFCFGFSYNDAQLIYEGIKCKNFNLDGICTQQPNCPQAVQEVKLNGYHNLTRCGFSGFVEIVCCPTLRTEIKERKSIQVCKYYEKQFPQIIEASLRRLSVSGDMGSPNDYESGEPVHVVAHGTDVIFNEFPHVVALGFYHSDEKMYKFDCGGTLISNKYVITAAHCIANIEGHKLEVIRMGTVEVPTEPVKAIDQNLDHKVKNVTFFPKYNRRRNINDIALVELENEVVFQINIRPACLYTKDEEPSQMEIAGWGAVNITGVKSEILQKANVSSVPIQQCVGRFRSNRRRIGSTQICAQDVKSDACAGDSGGPLHVKDNDLFKLIGITSFGYDCFGGLPGIYTKVSSYLDWIEETVWP